MSALLAPEFSHVLAEAGPWLRAWGYPLLAAAVAIEGTGIPAPGGLLLSGAALLAGAGELSLLGVCATAWSAAVVGDNVGYWLGRRGGRRLLLKAGVSHRRLTRLGHFARRWGIGLLLFGRFIDGPRQLNGLLAGSAHLPWLRFLFADAVGSALWVGFWAIGLYTLDRHGGALHRALLHINPWLGGATVLVVTSLAALWFIRQRSHIEE